MFKSQGPTEALKTVLGDPNRIRFMELSMEHEKLAVEWKQTSNFLDGLLPEYIDSKSLDIVRRYKKLQSIAKRIIFNLRLKDPAFFTKFTSTHDADPCAEAYGSILQSAVKQEALRSKHERICDGLSSEEILVEIKKLEQQNQDLQEQIDGLVETINQMDHNYQSCKGDTFLRRYLILKTNVKYVFEKNTNLR
ncbi:unnamed protein product [Schistocephalus solidus]|uniref:Uncharacterized protein n=1 Tax=Schistocephalus solidus TaxID=70667 RepID=A0A183SY21_SCHSO|nr:unnamed protein product [Schistocephalus solidus]